MSPRSWPNKSKTQFLVVFDPAHVKEFHPKRNHLRFNILQAYLGLLIYCQEFDRLLIEVEGQLLCYSEPTDELDDENLRICLPLSLFLACFRLGRYNEIGGHMGASKTYNNAKRFYYWPGMFDWICALTADCLTC